MAADEKPLVWLQSGIKTPPFTKKARLEAGLLLRRLQGGQALCMPQSRPMPAIGSRCHELRIHDGDRDWRIIYRIDDDAIIVVAVFAKKSPQTPGKIIENCKHRLALYDE